VPRDSSHQLPQVLEIAMMELRNRTLQKGRHDYQYRPKKKHPRGRSPEEEPQNKRLHGTPQGYLS